MTGLLGVATSVAGDVRLGSGLLVLLLVAGAAPAMIGVHRWRAVVGAALRAALQLAVVAAALHGVFARPALVVLALAVMFAVASLTAARRLKAHPRAVRAAVLACGAGASLAIGVVVGLPVLDRSVRTLVAVSGIVIGSTMTAATLTGRRMDTGLRDRRDEVEAWLAVGATMRQAVRPVAQLAVREALLPGLDQTRTVGLVTLPGAFVGALLGGAGAGAAARFQLVVLVALLCAQAVTATALAQLLGAPAVLPGTPAAAPAAAFATGWRARRRARAGSGVATAQGHRSDADADEHPREQHDQPRPRRQVR